MTEQEIKDTINGFFKAWMAGDTKQALSFFTDDAVFIVPRGTFKGTAKIEKYLTWVNKGTRDYNVTKTGIGIITQENIAVDEHRLSGISNGVKWEVPAVCIYEFKNGKIANMRGFYDLLSQVQQSTKGMFVKWMVNTVINVSKRGLK
jgi:ketosteroid isomerase-like protein